MFSNALPGLTDELKQVSQEMEVLLPKEWNRGEVGSIIQAVLAGRGKISAQPVAFNGASWTRLSGM